MTEGGSPSVRWSQDQVREFGLSLPEAHEQSHFGRPDLRVGKRIFATLPEDGMSVNLKTTPLGLDMLLREGDPAFADVWGGRWVGVRLDAIGVEELRSLVVEAYCLAAPKRLAASVRTDMFTR